MPAERATMSPAARRGRARIAVLSKIAQGKADTSAARAGWLHRFEVAVDPDGNLPPAERELRARAAMRAEMLRLNGRRHGHLLTKSTSEPTARSAERDVKPSATA